MVAAYPQTTDPESLGSSIRSIINNNNLAKSLSKVFNGNPGELQITPYSQVLSKVRAIVSDIGTLEKELADLLQEETKTPVEAITTGIIERKVLEELKKRGTNAE